MAASSTRRWSANGTAPRWPLLLIQHWGTRGCSHIQTRHPLFTARATWQRWAAWFSRMLGTYVTARAVLQHVGHRSNLQLRTGASWCPGLGGPSRRLYHPSIPHRAPTRSAALASQTWQATRRSNPRPPTSNSPIPHCHSSAAHCTTSTRYVVEGGRRVLTRPHKSASQALQLLGTHFVDTLDHAGVISAHSRSRLLVGGVGDCLWN